MDKKYNFIAGILCYLISIIYLVLGLSEGSLPCAIGFIFWILAGFFQIDTYRNKRRNGK